VTTERFRLATFGAPRLTTEAAKVLPGRRKLLALLTYLAARSPAGVARDELATLFWGERDEARARQSLRQALKELRGALGERIEVLPRAVALGTDAIEWDTRRFLDLLDAGRHEDAAALWAGGELLAGCDDVGTAGFSSWLDAERERLHRLGCDALERLAMAAEQRGEWSAAVEWLDLWVAREPWSETANARLIAALRLSGRPDLASGAHAAAVARIRTELGTEPSPGFARLGHPDASAPSAVRWDARSAALLSPDLIGRGDAFASLADAWMEVRGGAAAAMLVAGEEGIGKTRLCEEFLRWLDSLDGATVLRTRAFAAERAVNGAVLHALLANLPGAPGLAGAPDHALAAVASIVPGVRDRYPHLPSTPRSSAPPTEALRRVLADIAAEIPVVLFVDDLPAADAESLDALLALARRLPDRCLLVATACTPDPGFAQVEEAFVELPDARRITLAPLDAVGVELLLASMIPIAADARRALAVRLHAETGGNPFYVVALVSALADANRLRRDAHGVWTFSLADEELPLPASVRDAIEARLRHLSPGAYDVLTMAALTGHQFEPGLIECAVDQAPDEFCDSVEELIARRLLRISPSAAGCYEFAHDLIRRVAREQLGPARRQLMLRNLAAANGSAPAPPLRGKRGRTVRRPGWAGGTGVRAAAFVMAAIAVVVASGIAASEADRGAGAAAPGGIAVLPFEYHGADEFRYLSEGLAELLSVHLDRSDGLVSVDPRVLLGFVGQQGGRTLDPAGALAVARRFGADHAVLGSVVEGHGRLRIQASVYGRDGEAIASASVVADGETTVLAAVDDLARQLLAERFRGTGEALVRTAAITTGSLPALRAYLEGERLLRDGRFSDAATAFATATEADTAFALAHYRLSVALEWATSDSDLADRSVWTAARHAHRLPARTRLLVDAAIARRRGETSRADALYQEVLSISRDDFEATFQLAETRFHDGPVKGAPFTSSKPYWNEVLRLDPGNGFALVHLARIAASEDSLPDFLARNAAAVDAVPRTDRRGAELELWKAVHERRPLAQSPHATRLLTQSFLPISHVLAYSRDLDAVEPLLEEVLAHRPTSSVYERHRADLRAARGRWTAADSVLHAADGRFGPWQHSPHRVLLGVLAADLSDAVDGTDHLARLGGWDGTGPGELPVLHAFVAGLLASAAGDQRGVARRADALDRIQNSPLARDLAITLRADALRRANRPDEAMRLLDRAGMDATWEYSFNSPFHSRAYTRWLRAEIHRERGDDEAALRLYQTLGQVSPFEFAFIAPAYLRIAGIRDRRGDRREAAMLYARFAEMWKDADQPFQPLVRAAAARASELRRSHDHRAILSRTP
jgi:DNA-binding SARP family transcriptional activator/tetratricopeptide (TPR) repeat protein